MSKRNRRERVAESGEQAQALEQAQVVEQAAEETQVAEQPIVAEAALEGERAEAIVEPVEAQAVEGERDEQAEEASEEGTPEAGPSEESLIAQAQVEAERVPVPVRYKGLLMQYPIDHAIIEKADGMPEGFQAARIPGDKRIYLIRDGAWKRSPTNNHIEHVNTVIGAVEWAKLILVREQKAAKAAAKSTPQAAVTQEPEAVAVAS